MSQVVPMVTKSDQNNQESIHDADQLNMSISNFSSLIGSQMKLQEEMEITLQQDFDKYDAQILSHGVVENLGNFWGDENVLEELNYEVTSSGNMNSNETPSQDVLNNEFAISIWDIDCDDSYS
ncbi:hypothetical protein FXO38_20799 [Capsicum annuum]|uniref:Uncharacterized protein n=1 Tax=Capsicum annuum TaxID=4072 RepID=A0A2G2ZJ31_CAPAN|nr:hypothetical protein FXO38_20799 [Capsicum annuum]KAF3643238.1 hypothetical protein FXO37_22098 [Capsicum annuum]PHT81935.1 hypothetical protein T459_14950 [Capsicum annuum]